MAGENLDNRIVQRVFRLITDMGISLQDWRRVGTRNTGVIRRRIVGRSSGV